MKSFAIFTIGFMLLSACENGDDPLVPMTKENTWYWGNFDLALNGERVAKVNDDVHRPVGSFGSSVYYVDKLSDSINVVTTGIWFDERTVINVTLYDLFEYERYVNLPYPDDARDNAVNITIYLNSDHFENDRVVYAPSIDNPFRVEIVDVIYLNLTEPVLTVKLDGTLYNREDPDDAIVIFGSYETRNTNRFGF